MWEVFFQRGWKRDIHKYLYIKLYYFIFAPVVIYLLTTVSFPCYLGATLPQWHRNEALRALVTLSASAPVISTSGFPSVYLNCHSKLVPSGHWNNPGDSGRCDISINDLTPKKWSLGCHSHSNGINQVRSLRATSHFRWFSGGCGPNSPCRRMLY